MSRRTVTDSPSLTAVTPRDRPSPTGSLSLTLPVTVPLAVTLVLVWKAVPQSRWHCGWSAGGERGDRRGHSDYVIIKSQIIRLYPGPGGHRFRGAAVSPEVSALPRHWRQVQSVTRTRQTFRLSLSKSAMSQFNSLNMSWIDSASVR